jgi:dihydroorotase
VTTAVDAGSAGADTFLGFKQYVIEVSETRLYAQLNISSQGMLSPQVGELDDLRWVDTARSLAVIEANRDLILGVKVRLTKNSICSQAAGLQPLHLAREVADAAGLPIMVHPQDAWTEPIDDILALMGARDITTHCFHGSGGCGILDDRGRVRESVLAAAERGVNFDVGHGQGSFKWEVAETALSQGFLPQTISSDLHHYNVDGPVFDLATTATKFLQLGLSLDEVIARVTQVPAQTILKDEIGTLKVGAWGDAVLLEQQAGPVELVDALGQVRSGRVKLVPVTVIKGGQLYKPPHAH